MYLRWDQYNLFSLEGEQTKHPNLLVPFCHDLRRRLKAMAMWPPCWRVTDSLTDHLTEQTKTDMSAKPAAGVE